MLIGLLRWRGDAVTAWSVPPFALTGVAAKVDDPDSLLQAVISARATRQNLLIGFIGFLSPNESGAYHSPAIGFNPWNLSKIFVFQKVLAGIRYGISDGHNYHVN